LLPLVWLYIHKTKPGLHLRAVGENPAAADTWASTLPHALSLHLCRRLSGRFGGGGHQRGYRSWLVQQSDHLRAGWIAVALVIFAQLESWRAALGGTCLACCVIYYRLQGPTMLFGVVNPFFHNMNLVFFLQMTPYVSTIIALIWGSSAARKKRSAPPPPGHPLQRGERGL
jgi:simple sugar transport system permease protein